MHPRRVLAYCRVSSEDQERSGTSLDHQRDEIARHCAAVGWPAPCWYVEARSAADADLSKRPEARRLLDELQPGDVVLVAKQDRWTRHAGLYMDTMGAIRGAGAEFFSLAERFDRTVPEGRFAGNISASVSELERERIFERTVGARRKLRDQGCWTEGVAPYGYTRDPKTRRLVAHPEDAERVRDIYARSIAGQSLPTIAQALRDVGAARAGGQPIRWDRKAVHRILTRREYLGEIRRTDGTWSDAHEPLVTRAVFDEAARSLAERKHGTKRPSDSSRTSTWLLRGLAWCGSCGARMGAAYGPRSWSTGYYVCAARVRGGDCDEPYSPVPTTDAQADREMLRRLEVLRHELARRTPADAPSGPTPESLAEQVDKAKTRRARVVSLHVDGTITRDELVDRVRKLDAEIASLARRAAEVTAATKARKPKARAAMLADVTAIRRAWDRAPVATRRLLLSRFARRIEVKDRAIRVTWLTEDELCSSR